MKPPWSRRRTSCSSSATRSTACSATSATAAIWGIYAFGDPKGFSGKFNLAVSNGTTDDGSGGKNNENTVAGSGNAQKDWTTRLEFAYGPEHKFGAYYREGVTGLKDSTYLNATVPATWTVGAPSAAQIKDNKDKTTLMGAYYAFDTATWHASAEARHGSAGPPLSHPLRRRHHHPHPAA